MKTWIGILFALYAANFIGGYAGVRTQKQKSLRGCEKLLTEVSKDHWLLLAVMIVMPGEANGCIDIGAFPQVPQ